MAKRFRQNTLDVFLKKKPKLKDQDDGYENKEESNREEDRDQETEESNREEDRDQETEESNREDDRDQNKMEESNREEDRDQNKMEESNSENDRDQETEESNREEDRDQETEEEDREQRNLDEDDISDEQGSENTDEGTLHPFDPVRMKKKINKGESLSDGDKTCLLQNRWIPPEQHSYPYQKFGAKQLKYNVQWEKKYEWLRYSPFEDSAYCAHCLSFNKLKGSNFSFLTKGFTDWKNAVGEKRGIIPRHSLTEGHRKSTEKAENFLSVVQKKRKDISSIISQKYEEKVIANRNSLLSIIDIIVCLGQRNVAFRGSWEGDSENGNFNHFVNWKAQFDVALKQHMQTAPKNAIYLSPAIQNELIECCAEEIRGTLINRIQAAQYFTVLADESMDISGTEQMSLCVRYVNEEEENLEIKEDFLGFCPLPKQDAATITSAILNQLTKWGLQITFLRGQGYDGASTMSGKVSGVQKRVKELYPRAMYTHCRSHALNLVVVHGGSDLPLVRNTMSIVEKIAVFFSATGARKDALRAESRREGQPKTAGIPLMSDIRWGSRANTLSAFVEQFTAIHSVLETMEAEVTTTSGKASTLRHSIGTFETIITAVIANKVLGYMLPLTKKLQSTNLDIITAYEEARNVRQVIAKQRNEQGFSPCFQKATALANSVDVVPTKRRITVKQNYRANISTESVEDHYRVNLFYPFIDHITSELDERFSESNEPALLAAYLVPKSLKKLTEEREQRMVKWYQEDLPYPNTVEQEIECWRHKFHSEDGVLPASALETLKTTQMSFFPNIQCMLKIFLTLPVTTCECERSFSAMRRLKTWLRSSMSSERLTGLALMHVHQKVKLDKERVLRRWDASGHRRIQLAFNGK
ncbi:52 kDa repressor of the inhibitor of the protein kinase-like [Triplophysa dalaica]|uniref:52 kDa repressor of the inhibitor of the protein kinase-like n=1 Tax=Triplophysa dalaica TaxID=1582913 RepID=UPI0024DF65F5|nr:52 kDa repressor of the inhibitor of the protein kinase-like [Triplophysa dalaica]